ncbi:hypothetical protein CSKR_203348 [Clonorchis sinensis]|uniref:Uncharacterized protein n=2 Tax=Clonorchis sinensis TaxID=79923 RepID=G7YL34_CLOSI|nr:hypothetical protein CSKR_203348 [Clonorchis sinensis]GAA53665.1 hypothetical protein CLF_110737 [Clonorchis sinensis]
MSIYATTIFLPSIAPPRIDLELNDTTYSSDDRLKIAEVEAAFEEFENELSLQLHRQISPVGKRLTAVPPGLDDLVSNTSNNMQRHGVSRGTLPSPLYSLTDGLHLDGELQELDLSSMTTLGSRSSGGRLPRRVGGTRLPTYTPSAPTMRRNSYTVGASVDAFSNLLGEFATASSAESRVAVSVLDPVGGSSLAPANEDMSNSGTQEEGGDTEAS